MIPVNFGMYADVWNIGSTGQDHWICIHVLSQEKEYKDALEAFNDKNKEKVQLITKLMEVS